MVINGAKSKGVSLCKNTNLPLQQIYYGAPGTGKSHEIKRLTAGKAVIRTTFHPDTDYSTFVGAYKPTMEDVEVQTVPVVVAGGITLDKFYTVSEGRTQVVDGKVELFLKNLGLEPLTP